MRMLLATLALTALTTVGGTSPAGAYAGPECNEFWKATRASLPPGLRRGRATPRNLARPLPRRLQPGPQPVSQGLQAASV